MPELLRTRRLAEDPWRAWPETPLAPSSELGAWESWVAFRKKVDTQKKLAAKKMCFKKLHFEPFFRTIYHKILGFEQN